MKKRENLILRVLYNFLIFSSKSSEFFFFSSLNSVIFPSVKEKYFIIESIIIDNNDEFMKCKDIVATNTNWRTISKEVPLEMIWRMLEKEDKKFKKLYKIQ